MKNPPVVCRGLGAFNATLRRNPTWNKKGRRGGVPLGLHGLSIQGCMHVLDRQAGPVRRFEGVCRWGQIKNVSHTVILRFRNTVWDVVFSGPEDFEPHLGFQMSMRFFEESSWPDSRKLLNKPITNSDFSEHRLTNCIGSDADDGVWFQDRSW
jgi:hypothetical protein